MDDPYKPPAAPVADADDIARGPRPAAVKRACTLFWIGWGLGFLALAVSRDDTFSSGGPAAGIALALVLTFAALSGWLIVMVAQGRNWARWTMVGLVVLGWITLASDPVAMRAQGELALTLDGIIFFLELYGSYLILTGEGARWFRKTA